MPKNLNVTQLTERYFDPSSVATEAPSFVLLAGGIGSGKTTLRNEQYSEGFVVVDGGEIFRDIAADDVDDVEPYMSAIDTIGAAVTERAIREHRNIVMEVIGDDAESLLSIRNAVTQLGYTCLLYT